MAPLGLQATIARVRADLDHHRIEAERCSGFAKSRDELVQAIREDRDAGEISPDDAAVRIAAADRERAEYLAEQRKHSRRADELEQQLLVLLRELAATVKA